MVYELITVYEKNNIHVNILILMYPNSLVGPQRKNMPKIAACRAMYSSFEKTIGLLLVT